MQEFFRAVGARVGNEAGNVWERGEGRGERSTGIRTRLDWGSEVFFLKWDGYLPGLSTGHYGPRFRSGC